MIWIFDKNVGHATTWLWRYFKRSEAVTVAECEQCSPRIKTVNFNKLEAIKQTMHSLRSIVMVMVLVLVVVILMFI